MDSKRSTQDLLPYLPAFRTMFAPLPADAASVKTAVSQVLVDDVECVTQEIIKVRGHDWYIKIGEGSTYNLQVDLRSLLNSDIVQKQWAEQDFVQLYSNWASAAWQEQKWDRVNDLGVRDLLVERNKMADIVQNGQCLQCPNFIKHYGMQHDEWLIQENIESLKMLMSDQNLSLLPDYQQRVEVLKDLGFVDEHLRIQLKGKVACEIHSADELVLTELILENVLAS